MEIEESTIDKDPSKKDLTSALHTIDNLVNLLEMVTIGQKKAVAASLGKSADGRLAIYITATKDVDEEKIARLVAKMFSQYMIATMKNLDELEKALIGLRDVLEPVTANTREETLAPVVVLAMRAADEALQRFNSDPLA